MRGGAGAPVRRNFERAGIRQSVGMAQGSNQLLAVFRTQVDEPARSAPLMTGPENSYEEDGGEPPSRAALRGKQSRTFTFRWFQQRRSWSPRSTSRIAAQRPRCPSATAQRRVNGFTTTTEPNFRPAVRSSE